jgi:hypothetical protein
MNTSFIERGCIMKTFVKATAAAALLLLPGISMASSLDYVQSGSNYTVLFNPNGSGMDNLPASHFYRSYDCRKGSVPVVVNNVKVITTPPSNPGNNTPPPNTNTDNPTPPPTGGGDNTPPVITTPPAGGDSTPPVNPPGGCDPGTMASVPLPASSEMAGAGVVAIALASWHRSRRLARA